MKIEPKIMTDAELADFALTVASAFESQSLAGLEMNYDALANAGPAVLGHIAALTAARDNHAKTAEHYISKHRLAMEDRDAHAVRCVELQTKLTAMERSRDEYRAALAKHDVADDERLANWLARRIGSGRQAGLVADARSGIWRKDPP